MHQFEEAQGLGRRNATTVLFKSDPVVQAYAA